MTRSLLDAIVRVPVDELTLHPDNARRGDVPAIAASLNTNAQFAPIVVQKSTGHVLSGNHMLKAARELGWPDIDAVYVDVDDTHARRIMLAANRTADISTYDTQALTDLLTNLEGEYDGTGYTQQDLDTLLQTITPDPPDIDPTKIDDIPEPGPPLTKPGDLWHLGPHRILCGDSTDPETVAYLLQGDLADCMWTDPPYGVQYTGKTKDALTIENDGAAGLEQLLAGAFAQATNALKPGSPIYIAHADVNRLTFETCMRETGWLIRQNLIWVKDNFALGRSDYHWRHEPILYAFAPRGEGRLGRGSENWHGDNAQDTIFEIPKPTRSTDHPTMKPVELITAMLRNSCAPGGLIYEPFAGSGSTIIAAHVLGMRTAAIEIDGRYVDVICRRYQRLTGEEPMLETSESEEPTPISFK